MDYQMTRCRLIKDVPILHKGLFDFEIETGFVYGVDDNGKTAQYPLRNGLADYLWLLKTEKGYFRKVKQEE